MDMVSPSLRFQLCDRFFLHLAFQVSMKDHAAADESLEKLIGRREKCIEACGPTFLALCSITSSVVMTRE
ncbi:MAG TPA: hypothetical protein VE251_03380 [Xanthobacteraceae bacterium]|nr:hypothetical protein [Xanthobacteraceae bacterium]